MEIWPCLFLIKREQGIVEISHPFPRPFPSLLEEPSFQTYHTREPEILKIKLRTFTNRFSALPTKNGQLIFLLDWPGENYPISKNALHLRNDKRANSFPTHRKTTLGFAPKSREEKQESCVMFFTAENSLKLADGKRERKRWEASKIKMH